MSDHHLTPGAVRVLDATSLNLQSPVQRGEACRSLLRFLFHDEGHGSELLRSAGVTEIPSRMSPASTVSADDLITVIEWKRELLRRANQFAIGQLESEDTGTEHLLLALIDLDSETSELLEQFDITVDRLIDELRSTPPELSVPDDAVPQLRSATPGAIDQSSLHRILDASANRCREGLRVVEDYVRFTLDDQFLSTALKGIRHQLTLILSQMGQQSWIPLRDTVHDVGTLGQLASERHRGAMIDVVRASCKRVEESLRSLEEYGKLIDAELSHRLTQARYRFYTVEKAIESIRHGQHRLVSCSLYLLVTDLQCRYGAEKTIRNTITAGVDVVQIREKGMTDRQLIAYGEQIRRWTAAEGTLLIMNDRPDIAAAIGADGVHLGQDDMTVEQARRVLGGGSLIGVSTHCPEQAEAAVFAGADYLGVGPVFPSRTKQFDSFAGLEYVQQVAESVAIPWFAIGGITLENLGELTNIGAARVAVSGAICEAPHPRGVAQAFSEKLRAVGVHPSG